MLSEASVTRTARLTKKIIGEKQKNKKKQKKQTLHCSRVRDGQKKFKQALYSISNDSTECDLNQVYKHNRVRNAQG